MPSANKLLNYVFYLWRKHDVALFFSRTARLSIAHVTTELLWRTTPDFITPDQTWHVAIELARPNSGGLRHLVCHSSCLQQCLKCKTRSTFSKVMITNALPPFCGLQCTRNSYNSCHRYTRTIKMLYFDNSFQYIQKSATYAAKNFQLQAPNQRPCLWTPLGAQSQTPSYVPQYLLFPQTQGVWIKPCLVTCGLVNNHWLKLDSGPRLHHQRTSLHCKRSGSKNGHHRSFDEFVT